MLVLVERNPMDATENGRIEGAILGPSTTSGLLWGDWSGASVGVACVGEVEVPEGTP